MKRKIYLSMQSREDAQQLFLNRFQGLLTDTEEIDSSEADGRVTAEPVRARFSSPSFHSAAMDGLAVLASDTFRAADDNPVCLDIASGQARPINTGHPLPADKNAVIMIENVLLATDETSGIIRAPVYPWQHVRKVGEDIVATELLFPSHHLITPPDMAALLTAGCPTVRVRKKPTIIIMPTGSELVDLSPTGDTPPAGKTIESNSAVLAGLAKKAGGLPTVMPITSDDYENIKQQLHKVAQTEADVIVVNAGSSAGSADYTVQVIEELGEVLVHGVTIMPCPAAAQQAPGETGWGIANATCSFGP